MRWAGVLTVAVLAALPAAAEAHSVVRITGTTGIYVAADATSLNTLTGRLSGSQIELRDQTVDGGIDPGPCDPGEITPDANAWIIQVFCPRARITRLRVDLGEREDRATLDLPLPLDVAGGPGSDTLRSGPAADEVAGNEGNDTVAAGAGNDAVDGGLGYDGVDAGAGDDRIGAADGLADRVTCGSGRDTVDADTLDAVAGDCEDVRRRAVAPPPEVPSADDREPPRVDSGARSVQRLGRGRIRMLATSSERGTLAASGFLDVGGISLPLQSDRRRVTVAGGGARLTIRLSRRQRRLCRRALARGRRPKVRMWAVATDLAGNSAQARPIRIRLRR